MDEYIGNQVLYGRPVNFAVPSVNSMNFFKVIIEYLRKNEVPDSVLDYIITPGRIMPKGDRIKRVVRMAMQCNLGDFIFHLLSKQNGYEKIYVDIKKMQCKNEYQHSRPLFCICDRFSVTMHYHRDGTTYVDDFSVKYDVDVTVSVSRRGDSVPVEQILMWRKIMAELQGAEQIIAHSNDMKFSFSRIN